MQNGLLKKTIFRAGPEGLAGPFTIYALAYVCGFEWDNGVKATGLILLPVGLVLLALGYGVDPGIA